MRCNLWLVLLVLACAFCVSPMAAADPIPGRNVLKFQQKPMINTTIPGPNGPETFNGHDELSTAWGVPDGLGNFPTHYEGTFMADDFADRFDSPVVHVKWWGSYLNQPTGTNDRVRRFLISFEDDVPQTAANNFSHPGEERFNQIVGLDTDGVLTPGSGTFTERVVAGSTSIDGPIFEYNAELHLGKAFREKANVVYWLKIVALEEIPTLGLPEDQRLQWGWHNRDYTVPDGLASRPPLLIGPGPGEHNAGPIPGTDVPVWHFQDDAVSGHVIVDIDAAMPIMPRVDQPLASFVPQRYLPPHDGPSPIANFSKDLAFELYTVPEPGAAVLSMIALMVGSLAARRRT